MNELMAFLRSVEITEDKRQSSKVKHSMAEIIMLVFFGVLANAEYFEEIELIAKHYESELKKYLLLPHGIPSHDTMQRVMGLVSPTITGQLSVLWNRYVSTQETEKLRKILAIDGKTMRGNRSQTQKAAHIVTAFDAERKFCLGQTMVQEKSNEITAVPQLLRSLEMTGYTVTADAMSTQTEIASLIIKKKADYVLVVKENQLSLYEEIKAYLDFPKFQEEIKAGGAYKVTVEGAHGQVETREYFQTSDISWLIKNQKGRWKNLKSIGMNRTTLEKADGTLRVDCRYFISSLEVEIDFFADAVRKHWSVESMHWELDVVFREDANKTLDQVAAQNLNNIYKFGLRVLKDLDMGKLSQSGRKKRFALNFKLAQYLEELFEL